MTTSIGSSGVVIARVLILKIRHKIDMIMSLITLTSKTNKRRLNDVIRKGFSGVAVALGVVVVVEKCGKNNQHYVLFYFIVTVTVMIIFYSFVLVALGLSRVPTVVALLYYSEISL